MWNLMKWFMLVVGLKKRKDKYEVVNGVKCRIVAEPYPPPKGK